MKLKDNQFSIVRIYDHPVQVIWRAFTEEKHVAHWWGPRGFRLTSKSKDLKVGGQWIYTMHGPDGVDYPNITTYHEVVPGQRLVYDHGASEGKPPLFRVEATFKDLGNKTQLELIMTLATAEAAREIRTFIKSAGGDSTWDRLAEYLADQQSGKKQFVINRSFPCSIEKMYELWTSPLHISRWLAPVGFSMKFHDVDIRAGGQSFYEMTNGGSGSDLVQMFGKIYYQSFERPHRLVYFQEFATREGAISRHPMLPTYPARIQTTVEFVAEEDSVTRVKVTWEPVSPYSQAELDVFLSIRGGMTQGWTGSFDKLEKYLLQQ